MQQGEGRRRERCCRHVQAAGNPINVANACARCSSQSAKQLRIYLTPSQAIKHFSFIHGRCRAATHAIPAIHKRETRDNPTLTHFPQWPLQLLLLPLLHCCCCLASCSARQNNSHIWHATCLCFWPWVIDGHANDQQQGEEGKVEGGGGRMQNMRCSC